MTVSEYQNLRQEIINAVLKGFKTNHHLLDELKELFKKEINSRRRFEDITTFTTLFNILEMRDVLSEDNVEAFKEIAHQLSNSRDLLRKISDYQSRHILREYVNYYTAENSQNTTSREHSQSILNSHPYGLGVSKTKLERIRDIITQQIGTCWRDLGRNLTGEIRECDLDKIDVAHPCLEKKAHELMLLYERKADPQRWFMILCNALVKSRRRDLNNLIQEAMTMNI